MSVAFDAVAPTPLTGSNLTGSPVGQTMAHTATSGADIFVVIGVSNSSPTSVQYGGTSLTLLSSVTVTAASTGSINLYHGAGLGTGSSQNVTFSCPATAWLTASSVSYTGVGSVGTAATTSGASSLTVSTGSVSCTTGQEILAVLFSGMSTSDALSSLSGGTNRSLQATSSGNIGMAVSDATSTTTFTATAGNTGATGKWATIAVVLSPPTGTTCTPTTATIAVTGSGPGLIFTLSPQSAIVSVSGNVPSVILSGNINPTTATVTITGGTPSVTLPAGTTPATATITVTGGTPTWVQSHGPLAKVLNNLTLNQSTTIQVIGDSTAFSAWDTGFSEGTTPWTPGTLQGWPGRMVLALGEYFNANVNLYWWNYPTDTAYSSVVDFYNATGGGRPTITLYLGGWPGGVMSNYISEIATMLPVANADIVILHDGFNETSTTTYATNVGTFISDVQSTYCPGAPILVTTQNATTEANESGHPSFASIFAALVNVVLSTDPALPLSPPLQYSNTISGVWILDTQQAGQNASTLFSDGLHPIAPGYAEQAQFMLNQLTSLPGLVEDSGLLLPTTATIHISGGTPVLANVTTVFPTTATITITGGTPSVTDPNPINAFPTTATITITGGVSSVTGIGRIITPATATIHIAGTASVVVNGSALQELVFFEVTAFYYDLQSPAYAGNTNDAVLTGISGGNVTFTARLPAGFTILITDLDLGSGNFGSTALALPPITGKVVGAVQENGGTVWQLCANNSNNSPGIELVANSSAISAYLTAENINEGELIYDVEFTDVTFAGETGSIANFAFAAPTSDAGLCLTDTGSYTVLPWIRDRG